MVSAFLIFASAAGLTAAEPAPAVRSANGEFIFSHYPSLSLAAGEQGQVRFRAEVDDKGKVSGCRITASSGFERLDRETCRMIADHATFAPTLDGNGKATPAIHEGFVNWRISESAAPPAPAPGRKMAGRNMDEMVCKKQLRTGSLVASSRLCMTRREWALSAERNQNEWGELQGAKGSSREDAPTFPGGSPP